MPIFATMSILHSPNITLLLVDSDVQAGEQLQAHLATIPRYNIAFRFVPSYSEGIEALTKTDIDLCIAIDQIENESCLQFVEALQQMEIQTPVVVLSNHENRTSAVEALKAGAYDYQTKAALSAGGLERMIRNVLDRSLKSQMLRARKEIYEKTFRLSTDAMFFADANGTVNEANPAFLHQYSASEASHPDVLDLFVDQKEIDAFRSALSSQGHVQNMNCRIRDADGNVQRCRLSLWPLDKQHAADSLDYIGRIQDLTTLLEAERRSQQAARWRLTGRFARMVGHEIRNPLTNIGLGVAELRDEIASGGSDTDMLLDLIDRNARRIENLVRQLLDSAKPVEVNLQVTQVQGVLAKAIAHARDRLQLAGIKLVTEFDETIHGIAIDAPKVEIALLNLMINAAEAMKDSAEKRLTLRLWQAEDGVWVEVEDTGPGMDEDTIEQIFDPYFTGKSGGTGMGLTTVKNIVEAHGGEVNVHSILGRGTRMSVRLPVAVREAT